MSILKKTFKEVYLHLPVWFFAYQGYSILNMEVNNLDPPKLDFAFTAVFTLFWVFLFYALRIKRSTLVRKRLWLTLLPILLGLPVFLILFASRPVILDLLTLKRVFEVGTALCVIILAVQCYFVRGRSEAMKIFVVGLIYGVILENSGILMGFFHEPGYKVYIWKLPAPLFTMTGWCTAVYSCTYIARYILGGEVTGTGEKRRHSIESLRLASLATLIALSLDVQLDPAATYLGWWVWDESLQPFFLGVPLINYLAWTAAISPFVYYYFYLENRTDLSEARRTLRLLTGMPAALGAAAVMVLLLTFLLAGGYDSHTMIIFRRSISEFFRWIWSAV